MADIVENPPEELRLEAAAFAAYQTFTTPPGPLVRKINSFRHEWPMLRFIVPFLSTPANIFKYTLERTPLAPVTARYRAALAKGGADADMARTRMMLGTAVMFTAIDLALDGHITGSGPTDRNERALLRRTGWRPNSIRIGDTYIAFNRLSPIGDLLLFGGNIGEFLVNADDMDADSAVLFERALAASIFSAAEVLQSKTSLTGFSDLVEAVSDPDRYGATYLKRFAGSFVPVALREVATAIDPVARETAGMMDEMKARLPWFSKSLAVGRDLWGRPKSYRSDLGGLYDTVSPLYGATLKPEPIDKELEALGWFPSMPAKSFIIDKVRVNFSDRPHVYSRFLELRGNTRPSAIGADFLSERFGDRTMLETLNGIVQGEGERGQAYVGEDDPEKRKRALEKVVELYRDAAKTRLLEEFPELLTRRDVNAARKRRLGVVVPGLTDE
jgi:hypothetical protein